ncbi:MAG: serine/threonine protein kinase [Ardenticatenaceae bacterium]
MDLVGKTLGNYLIETKIGEEAGMVDVYKAYDPAHKREVRVKVLFSSDVQDDEFVQRFRLEAHTLAELTHPHIVPVSAQWKGEPLYIVYDLGENNSLANLIKEEAPLPPERVITLLKQIASGLDYAHTRSVIHQELKPSHILLNEQGAQINSFRLFSDHDRSRSISQRLRGMLSYVAPEQIKNQTVTAQTDIYALGIIAVEMLSGQVPFQSQNSSIFQAHLNQQPPSLHELNPRLPSATDQVIWKALAKNPSQRYLSASLFVYALNQALQGHSTLPPFTNRQVGSHPQNSFRERLQHKRRRQRVAWNKVAMVFVILCSCEIIRLSVMQVLITQSSLAQVTMTPIAIPTMISLGSPTATTVSLTATAVASPDALENTIASSEQSTTVSSESVITTSESNTTATREPSPTATQPPSPTATQPPTPTATQPPTPTATKPPTSTATKPPTPTATEPPSPTPTELPSPTATKSPTPRATEPPTPTATEPPIPTQEPIPTAPQEPSAPPTEVLGPPSGTITDYQVNHGVLRNGDSSIQILSNFTVYNLQGVNCQLAVYFYDFLGNPLPDQNGRYVSNQGQIFVGEFFVPDSNYASYTDFELFIPYTELDLLPGTYDFKLGVELLYGDEFTLLTQSRLYEFKATIE